MWRPLPRFDRLGRPQKDPKRLGQGLTLTILCAQAGIPLDEVPGEFWSLDAHDDGEAVAVVSCPCGEAHAIPLLEGPVGFGTDEQPCQRAFLFDGTTLWLLNSPRHQPAASIG